MKHTALMKIMSRFYFTYLIQNTMILTGELLSSCGQIVYWFVSSSSSVLVMPARGTDDLWEGKKTNGFKLIWNNLRKFPSLPVLLKLKKKIYKMLFIHWCARSFFLSCYWLDRCVCTGWNVWWEKKGNAVHRQGELNLFTIWVTSWNLQLQTGKKKTKKQLIRKQIKQVRER